MEFKIIALVFGFASAVTATPLLGGTSVQQPRPAQLKEIYRETANLSSGSLIWYGSSGSEFSGEIGPTIHQASTCTSRTPEPTCDDDHVARGPACDALVAELYDHNEVRVPESPRQVCYRGDSPTDEYCCVSWHNKIKGLTKSDLAPVAMQIFKTCTGSGISGKIRGVRMLNTCTDVCMSNRGTHC